MSQDAVTNFLVVEDDDVEWLIMQKSLKTVWERHHEIFRVRGVKEAQEMVRKVRVDVLILDLHVSDSDGLATVEAMTSNPNRGYVIVIATSNADKKLALLALERGAQDFVVKGKFSPQELGRAIEFAQARGGQTLKTQDDKISIDFGRLKLISRLKEPQAEVDLTSTELKIMTILVKHLGEPVPRQQLINQVAGPNVHTTERSTANQMSRLRTKLAPTGFDIRAIRGVGYVLEIVHSKKS